MFTVFTLLNSFLNSGTPGGFLQNSVAYAHRLIIPRLTKLFVFLENWTFCYPVLGSRHCTCAYTETADPACRPSIPHKWYWQGTAGVSRFNLKWKRYRPLPFSPLEVHTLCLRPWPSNCFQYQLPTCIVFLTVHSYTNASWFSAICAIFNL